MNSHIFLLLGSNVGNKMLNFDKAKKSLSSICQIVKQSALYKTAAWGNTNQPDFYNQVIEVTTALSPESLLEKLLSIEVDLGRIREQKWGPRVIDIDILFYGDRIIQQENLTVPHPGIPARRFVLQPMAEVAAQLKHPVLQKTIEALLEACTDPLLVEPVEL